MKAGRHRPLALTLIAVGLVALAIGVPPLVETISASWLYRHSPEAERAARPVARLVVQEPSPVVAPMADVRGEDRLLPQPANVSATSSLTVASSTTSQPVPRYAAADELELSVAELRFDDPPEAGARARLVLELHNRSDFASTPLVLAIPAVWFDGYRLLGASPELIDDQVFQESTRLLTLPDLGPDASVTYELQLTALDDDVSPPELRLLLADGSEVASPGLEVVGPRPRPGLARLLSIPRLNLQASVVQTVWEPPRFVVGQIQGSALLGEGNSVLVGHLTGPAGDVFAQLNQLQPGDEVTAVSRGVEYRFMVSETLLRPNDDSSPMDPTSTPRLTMMTCAGTWNPLTRDYSHRIWVVAEPPELAEATIAAQAERAGSERSSGDAQPAIVVTPEAGLAALPTIAAPAPPALPSALMLGQRAVPSVSPLVVTSASGQLAGPSPGRWRPLADRRVAVTSSGRPARAGLTIASPVSRAWVPARLLVRGGRGDPVGPAWLVVRALQPGARWYLYPRELVSGSDGDWQAELTLGGAAGLRHELRVGLADPEAQALFLRQVATHPDEPLDGLPPGFRPEAIRIVTRR